MNAVEIEEAITNLAEQEFDSKTVGLVSLQDFRAAREAVEKSAKNLVEVEKQEQDRRSI